MGTKYEEEEYEYYQSSGWGGYWTTDTEYYSGSGSGIGVVVFFGIGYAF